MKQLSKMKAIRIFLFAFLLLAARAINAQIGIGIANPVGSAQLDVSSSNKGFLPPRMTGAQRNAILTPVPGLMVWCTNCGLSGEIQVYNGTSWTNMVGGPAGMPGIKIGNQLWTIENLDITTYRNGDIIPEVTDAATWASLTTGAWCYFANSSSMRYKLYNWYAVHDSRGLAPEGYHIPTDAEWTILTNYLGGESVAGGKMKVTGEIVIPGVPWWATPNWLTPNIDATNSSGFAGLASGSRLNNGVFNYFGRFGFWWSSSEYNIENAWSRILFYNSGIIQRTGESKRNGFSVRCIKD